MEKERSKMGRFEILKAKQITEAKIQVVEELDKNTMTSINTLSELLQFKSIMVCQVGEHHLIIDGNKHFKNLKKLKVKKILCYNLGHISRERYLLLRLLLNVNQARLDYIQIATTIKELVSIEVKNSTISNLTGIDLQTVTRYSKLLDFDWDEFSKKKINTQINPFEDER